MTKIDEATVRACIEALDNNEQHYARDTLLALLPKPVDPAEQLVEEFELEHNVSPQGMCHEIRIEVARWMLARQPEPVARKEWSEEEIAQGVKTVLARNTIWVDGIDDAIRRGIEIGRQLAPVDPVNPTPLTHDEIIKEAREWCAKAFLGWGGAYRDGRMDNDQYMKLAIAILTAWKGEK